MSPAPACAEGDAGYTLAESLAALMMIGLAIGGLTLGAQTIGRVQSAAGRDLGSDRAQAQANRLLQGLLAHRGPFRADLTPVLTGTDRRLSFDCGAAAACAASLQDSGSDARLTVADGRSTRSVRLPHGRGARFVYSDAAGALPSWPAASGQARTLKSIAVVRGPESEALPLAAVTLWKEQAAACRYDMIRQDCRGGDQ